jgi:suppressor of ftsI
MDSTRHSARGPLRHMLVPAGALGLALALAGYLASGIRSGTRPVGAATPAAPTAVAAAPGSAAAAPTPGLCPPARPASLGGSPADLDAWSADVPASPDLYCINLIAIAELPEAAGTVELRRLPDPFDLSVGADGSPRFRLVFNISGLPDPARLGAFTTYVAWLTTPVLSPMVRLGPLANGETELGVADFNKFLILVTAEPSADGTERRGKIVLRGGSPSTRMRDHDLLSLPFSSFSPVPGDSVGEAGPTDRDGGHGRGWPMPPPHPRVAMLTGLAWLRPDARPFLPPAAADAPIARPRRLISLSDGDTLYLEAGPVRRTIRGREFTMYGFNGQYPGPLIHVLEGAEIVVEFTNDLDLPTTVHWHGIRLDNRFDGVPGLTQPAVEPGGRFTYVIRFPDAGIYWYHPHHREDIQQDLGLYGNMFVQPSDSAFFGPANRDEFLMLDDLLVGAEGLVPYGTETPTHAIMGRFGNVMLVNGEPDYRMTARAGEVVRLFLTNVSNTRTFNLSLPGAQLKVIGSDLGKFEREVRVDHVVIAPAERYIVDARFGDAGTVRLLNRVQGIDHVFGLFFPEEDTLGVVEVLPEPSDPDYGQEFATLRRNGDVSDEIAPYRRHFARPIDHELVLGLEVQGLPFAVDRVMRLDSAYFPPVEWSGTMPVMNWATTGREVRWTIRDPATGRENRDIAWRFTVGDVRKLRLVNTRAAFHAMQHPIHIHGQRFLVLSVNGVPNDNLVWKDTMLLPVGSSAEILLELSNPGDWMLHCHIAEHLATGMAMVFRVDPAD